MRKFKNILILMPVIAFLNSLSAQNYLSKDRENEIKTSERYYWSECSDFKEDIARQCAFDDLKGRVISNVVKPSKRQDNALKAIEMGTHFDRLQQKGKIKILAWIAKDSMFITTQRPPARKQQSTPAPVVQPKVGEKPQPQSAPVSDPAQPSPKPRVAPVATDNPILQELAACKNYREVHKVAKNKGLVRGSSSEGFANPAKCIIAVFTTDGTLSALLDTGSNTRTDLLSGKTIQNPEQHYDKEQYSLWYLQQK
jgi:hypothetical protein